jgi:hypothetical protein
MEGKTPNNDSSNAVIRFACTFCGQNIRVPQKFAGKKGKCPKCSNAVAIPQPTPLPEADQPIRLKQDYDLSPESNRPLYTASDAPRRMPPEPLAEIPDKTIPVIEQPPATFLNIFTFPFSLSGIIHLIIFSISPLVLLFLQLTLSSFCCYGQLLAVALIILMVGYLYYYLTQCIIAAAKDERYAPDISHEDFPTAGDLLRRLLLFFSSSAICFIPALAYILYSYYTNVLPDWQPGPFLIIWSLVGIFFCPMFLLAVAMFDSITALNPFMIIGSIVSTFLPYSGLVLLFFGIGWLIEIIVEWNPVSALLLWVFDIYLMFIAAYILGRFFRRYENKLNWEVKL